MAETMIITYNGYGFFVFLILVPIWLFVRGCFIHRYLFVLGCPVAVSNIYGMPEQVGDAALLFDPKNVDEIATVLERLWIDDDLCATLIERGKKWSEKWGPSRFNQRLKDIVETMILVENE